VFLGKGNKLMRQRTVIMSSVILFFAIILVWRTPPLLAQMPTSTPLPIQFPTSAPHQTTLQAEVTDIPTFTPTPPGPAVLRLREGSGDVNIRAAADPSAELLGQVRTGEEFVVTGRYYQWYQIYYEQARDGIGYVYGELVEIDGNPFEIPDLTVATPTPPLDPALVSQTETAEAILSQPDGELTLTASVRQMDAPLGSSPLDLDLSQADGTQEVLPTFTYPPDVIAQVPTLAEITPTSNEPEQSRISLDVSNGVAPIVPILVLAGLGVIAFLIGLLQRG
jgi:hypothetical protein